MTGGPSDTSLTGFVDITTANTITLSDAEATTGVAEHYIQASMFSFDSGDKLRLYFKYKDSTHYWYAQITTGASGSIKIFERSGGSETERATVAFATDPETFYTLAVCYGDGRVKATETITGTKCTYTVATTIDDQLKAGVGVGTLATFAEFSEFLYRYLESPEKPTCEPCPAIAQGCEICSDDFTRSNGTDITTGSDCGWSEAAGSWSISSNALITTSSDAIALSSTSHPLGTANMRVKATVYMPTSGDIARIITAYTDSTHYWYIEFKVGTSGYLRIYQVNGGAPIQKKTLTTNLSASNLYTLCVSITNGNLLVCGVYLLSTGVLQATLTWGDTFSGAQFGLGTGTIAGTVTFDNFEATLTNDTDPCPACSVFKCTDCDSDVTAAAQVKLVISGVTDTGWTWMNGTWFCDYYDSEPHCCLFRAPILSGPQAGHYLAPLICEHQWVIIHIDDHSGAGTFELDWSSNVACGEVDLSIPNRSALGPGFIPQTGTCLLTFPA